MEAAHSAIADLAAVLVAVRAGLGGECVRAGSHLEMGEIDLLSARDAVEKARLEIDLAGPAVADVRVTVPLFRGMDRNAEHGTRGQSCHGRRGAIPTAGSAPGGDAATRVPGTWSGRAVLGARRHVVHLAVGVSRSGRSGSTRAVLERVLIRGDGTAALQGDGAAVVRSFVTPAALRYGPAARTRRDLRSGQPVLGQVTTVRSLWWLLRLGRRRGVGRVGRGVPGSRSAAG